MSDDRWNQRERAYLVALCSTPGLGAVQVSALTDYFGSAEGAWQASATAWLQVRGIGTVRCSALARHKQAWGCPEEKWRAFRSELGLSALVLSDARYPPLLRHISHPPPLLFVRGEMPPAAMPCVALVGSRNPSPYGRQVAHTLAREMVSSGVVVSSGLAVGIDAEAHRGALAAGGRTVAVMGTGPERIYPAANRRLAEQIIDNGALLSEYAPGTPPTPGLFPRRNRLISGISRAVVVVEAGPRSGALITAAHAVEQNREVLAVPGDIGRSTSAGTNELLAQGAIVCRGVEDILTVLGQTPQRGKVEEAVGGKVPPAGDLAARLTELLSAGPVTPDDLASRLGCESSAVMALLTRLEVSGRVRRLPGGVIARV